VVYYNPFFVDFKIAEEGVKRYQMLNCNGDLVAVENLDFTPESAGFICRN